MRFNDNNIETTRSNDSLNFKPSGTGALVIDSIDFNGATVSTNQSNADLELSAASGEVTASNGTTIDGNLNIKDNVISATQSDSDVVLSASGTGSVSIANVNLNEGSVDNTTIGATTPSTATFTTLTGDTLNADGVQVTSNTISTTQTNADLELNGLALGVVVVNGLSLPNEDGTVGKVLKTNGSGTISFQDHSALFDHSFIEDGTATVLGSSSSAQIVDTWDASTHRSVKYHLQISDATADRYRLIDANVTHDGVTAYISVFGGVDNGDGDGSSVYDTIDFSADISGGNVRLLGTVNNTNDQVIKLVRRTINT
jgi:hypothetical protein